MPVIYLIRHANTVANQNMRFLGHMDSELSELGVEQVKKLAEFMKDHPVEKVYASPKKRAITTAGALSDNIKLEDSLTEMNFGLLEGHTLEEIKVQYKKEYDRLFSMGSEYLFPKGESIISFHERVKNGLYNILNSSDEKVFAIVAHSGTIRCILSELLGQTYEYHWNFQIDNCSITKITYDNSFMVINYLNSLQHLE